MTADWVKMKSRPEFKDGFSLVRLLFFDPRQASSALIPGVFFPEFLSSDLVNLFEVRLFHTLERSLRGLCL